MFSKFDENFQPTAKSPKKPQAQETWKEEKKNLHHGTA